MERPKALKQKQDIIEAYNYCLEYNCVDSDSITSFRDLKDFVELFQYIDHLELILLQNNIKF